MGIVMGIVSNGFYVQDSAGDGDPMTSDGILVYTRTRPKLAGWRTALFGHHGIAFGRKRDRGYGRDKR